jgi:hypothetical protein
MLRKSRFQEAEQQLKLAIKEEPLQNGAAVPPWHYFNTTHCIDLQVAFCSNPSYALLKTNEVLRYYRMGAVCVLLWGESDLNEAVKKSDSPEKNLPWRDWDYQMMLPM